MSNTIIFDTDDTPCDIHGTFDCACWGAPRDPLTMNDLWIGMVVVVNDLTARNPGGHGRITARSPKRNVVRVDSGEFPGQEVTGWYSPKMLDIPS